MNVVFQEPRIKDSKILAFADVDVADGVIVKGFRVIQGENGLFAAVPSRAVNVNGQTRYWNQVDFANASIRERFLGEILQAYQLWESSRSEKREAPTSASG